MDDLNEKDWIRLLSRALLELVREVESQAGEDGFGGVRPKVRLAAQKGRAVIADLDRATLERGS